MSQAPSAEEDQVGSLGRDGVARLPGGVGTTDADENRDGRWVAISASTTSVAERVMRLVGRPDIAEQPWFGNAGERVRHADLIDEPVDEWIGQRSFDEVCAAFHDAGAALAPVYDIAQLMNDPHVRHRETITTIQDEDLGPLKMQNLIFRLQRTPGAIRHGGRRLGQDTGQVLDDLLGLGTDEIDTLRDRGVL
jgi:crotonobetainyl-CoA:carnitine CoA-transferase CaiB-like acyl-CoA transferase